MNSNNKVLEQGRHASDKTYYITDIDNRIGILHVIVVYIYIQKFLLRSTLHFLPSLVEKGRFHPIQQGDFESSSLSNLRRAKRSDT